MIKIRDIRPDEHFFLRDMLREAAYFPDPAVKAAKLIELEPLLSKYFEKFGKTGDIALVAAQGGELIGAIWTRLFSKEKGSYGFVDEQTPELSIAIKEEFRSQGFGTQLIAKIIEKLADVGFDKVSLSVDKRNRAVGLYMRLGFQVHSEGETAYTMVKTLR